MTKREVVLKKKYLDELDKYKACVEPFVNSKIYKHTVESGFESLNDWSLFHSLDEVKEWFLNKRKNASMRVSNIPLRSAVDWEVDEKTGNIKHVSNDFFTIHAVRVETNSREVAQGWEQPIISQIGFDGGILGIICKRFEGIPHYLCEAKMEPGNYKKVQISPSLQATFSNLKKSHKGRKPYFAEYFEQVSDYPNFKILFDAWLAEDGGRFYLKRNKGMLLEVPEDFNVELPNDNFIWLSLYQIKALLNEDAWINPHIRGILAHA